MFLIGIACTLALGIVLGAWATPIETLSNLGAGSLRAMPNGVIALGASLTLVGAALAFMRAFRLALFAAVTALALLATWRQLQRPAPVWPSQITTGEPYPFDGCLVGAPEALPGGASRLHLVTGDGTTIHLVIASGPLADSVRPGSCFRVKAALSSVPNAEAGFRNAGAFRPLADMAKGAIYRATVGHTSALVLLEARRAQPVAAAAFALTRHLNQALGGVASGADRGLLKALVTGDRSELGEAVTQTFSELGVVHILSVSGLHLAVVAAALYQIFFRVFRRCHWLACRLEPRRLASLLVVPSAWAYTLVTGSAVATRRAAWMATHHFAAVVLGQPPCVLSSLGFAAIVELGADPLVLFDPSFQLSFAATLGLVARLQIRTPSLWDEARPKRAAALPGRLWAAITSTLSATLRATLFTLPISAWYFYHLPWASPLANLLIVPVCELIVLPGALAALLLRALFRRAGDFLLRLLAAAAGHLIDFAAGLAQLLPTLWIGQPPWPALALFGLFIVSIWCHRSQSRRMTLYLGAVCLFGSVAFVIAPRLRSPPLSAHFIDVGQGDSIFLELPGGKTMLVDGGGSMDTRFDPGKLSLVPFLRRRGVSTIDYLVLSHPHPDHMGGLLAVVAALEVGEVWTSGEEVAAPAFERLRALLLDKGITPERPKRLSWRYHGDTVTIEPLAPIGGALPERSINDNSVVLRVEFAGRRLLLTGDIERMTEGELVAAGTDLATDVLKVPHHGSRTSSTERFVVAAAPKMAIACAGRNNRFGFPHQEVTGRYTCPLCITGQNGAIEVTIEEGGTLVMRPLVASSAAPTCPLSLTLRAAP